MITSFRPLTFLYLCAIPNKVKKNLEGTYEAKIEALNVKHLNHCEIVQRIINNQLFFLDKRIEQKIIEYQNLGKEAKEKGFPPPSIKNLGDETYKLRALIDAMIKVDQHERAILIGESNIFENDPMAGWLESLKEARIKYDN